MQTPNFPGRLNLFQRTMLRWRELYPYNAVHVIRFDRPFDAVSLDECVGKQIESAGLAGFALASTRRRYRYRGGPFVAHVNILPPSGESLETIRAEMERQLNEAFADDGRADPFRFFASTDAAGFYFGMAYDHFIAGGDSIVHLLRTIHDAYCRHGDGSTAREVDVYPPTYRNLLVYSPLQMLRGLANLPQLLLRARRSSRPRYEDVSDGRNAFLLERLDAAALAGIIDTAKAWNVTVNDFCIAALLMALGPVSADRRQTAARGDLAVASIVNVRRDFGPVAQRAFGQFLASFRVGHSLPTGLTLRALAQDVQRITGEIKRRKDYLRIILALAFAGAHWPYLSLERRHRFFPRTYPVWGGITMLNVNALWPSTQPGAAADYLRGVSTGPLTPLVLAITTSGAGVRVGLSFRPSVFPPAVAARILAGFIQCVAGPEQAFVC